MKLRIVLFLLLSISVFFSIAYFEKVSGQSGVAPPIEWTKTYGGSGNQGVKVVQQTLDGGYALFGNSGMDGLLVKVDSNGDMQWNKTFNNMGIRFGLQREDGGYTLLGGGGLFSTDELGNLLWVKEIEGSIFSAQKTSDGGYVLAGVEDNSAFLLKTDNYGNVNWRKTYGVDTFARSVQSTFDGGFILAGEKRVSGLEDGWFAKTDVNGNLVWTKTYGWVDKQDSINCVETTTDGGYIMTGRFGQNPDSNHFSTGDFSLIKIDSLGNVQWTRPFIDTSIFPKETVAEGNSVRETTDGGFIAIGHYGPYEFWLVKTDVSGNILWTMSFSDSISSIIQTDDRDYVISGSKSVVTGIDSDFLLMKIMRANPPVSIFNYSPTNPTVREEVFFNASASYDLDEDIVSYRWDFSDGNITSTTTANISHSFELPGNYNVTLTVIDSEDLNSTYSQSILVKIHSSISISTDSEVSYASKPVQFAGSLIDANRNGLNNENVSIYYGVTGKESWTLITNVTTDSIGNFVSIWTPSNPGDYSVKVEWIGNQTFYGTSNTTNIKILHNPTLLSISLSSTSTTFGFKVGINGELTSNQLGLAGFPIRLSYSVTQGQTWNDISLINTSSEGKYSVEWMPSATGVYTVKAFWAGNSSYPQTAVTANLAVISFEEQTVFSVASNSTVTGLTFNSTSKELRFNLSGVTGTTGYVDACISKTLIDNIYDVHIYLNDSELEWDTISLDDSWLFHFTYNHSAHEVVIYLTGASAPTPIEISNTELLPILLVLGVIVVCGIVIYFSRRKKTIHNL